MYINKLLFPVYLIILSLLLSTTALTDYLEQQWEKVEMGTQIGRTNIWSVDLDGDGTEEILLGGGGYEHTHFSVLNYNNNDYVSEWNSQWYQSNPISLIQIANLDQDRDYEIYVILSDGQIEVFDGSTMAAIDTFTTSASSANSCKIADVDDDGTVEFAIVGGDYSNTYLQVYDANTFSLEWSSTSYGNDDVEVGDVDNDQQSEIVLAEGIILDGSTHTVEWSYTNGFGTEVDLADIDQDSMPEIIGMDSWDFITAFDGQAHTPLWQINTEDDHDALYVTDIEGDGEIEILMGNGQWGDINCFSASTQQLLWQINNPEHGVTNIMIGDPDMDGTKEVIWGANSRNMYIGSTNFHQIEWESTDLDGPFSIDVFDVDNDATYEIVGASNSSNNGYDGGIILVYDALLHSLELQTQPTSWDEINCITTGNINDTEQGEILVGIEDKIYVFDGQTLQQLWESPELGTINALQLADVDRDNVIEIIVGDYSGYVTVFSGQTFQQEWQSINTGGSIGGIKISNCDQDAAQEIIFFQEQGIIQIYDGETHYLEWQSSAVTNVTALDVGDYNLDGNKEMLTGHSNGMLTVIDCDNHNIVSQNFVANERIEGLLIANVDSVYGLDLLVGTSTLKLLESTNFQTIWESLPLGNNIGDHDNLTTLDVDNDQFMDIFFGSSWGMFHLESSTPYPDITPPAVVSNSPPDSLQFVGLDTDIKASFSEAIDVGTLNNNIVVESNTMDTVSTTITYDENTFTTIATPNNYLPANDTIVVTLTGNIADSSGNGLDGNGNGISEGSPLDDYVWTFYTGTGLDTIGPSITTATVAPDSVWRGIDVIIEAHISDSSHIAVSSVAYAECFVDSVGNFGNGIPLEPTDGAFDSVVEDAILTLDTEVWSFGNHTLYIHAQDANNNWGNIIELNVYVVEELAANWPMFGQNAQHSGLNAADSINAPLTLKFAENITTNPLHPVSVANDLIFVTEEIYHENGVIRCLNSEDGTELWSHSFGTISRINPPSFAYGYVFVQTNKDGSIPPYLTALDVFTGQIIWQSEYSAQWDEYMAPTIDDGKVFIGGGYYGGMYGYDAFTGQELWFNNDVGSYDEWTPAVFNDVAYAFMEGANDEGQLTAVDANTGMTIWTKTGIEFDWHGWSMYTAPVIDTSSNVIYVTSHDYLHAIDLNSHDVLWFKNGTFEITPAVFDNYLFAIESNTLKVYDKLTGQQQWSFSGDGNLSYPPVISNDYVFISSDQNTFALNIQTQQSEWTYSAGGHLTAANNHLYVATSSGNLLAFEGEITGIDNEEPFSTLPKKFTLSQNYPNPFNPVTHIRFGLPKSSDIKIELYNILGQKVTTILDERKNAGYHVISFDAGEVSSGIYFYRMTTDEFVKTRKMVVMK